MGFPDGWLKGVVRARVPGLRAEQRAAAVSVSSRVFRGQYQLSRRQVARYCMSRRTVLFAPSFPVPALEYAIVKALVGLGVRATLVPEGKGPEAVFAWHDATRSAPEMVRPLLERYDRVVNAGCLDIGKDLVERVHREVFGYGIAVDPRVEVPYLRKSIENAAHDATIFEAPGEPEPGYVYQHPIRNGRGDRFYDEVRLPVIGDCLPVCQLRTRPVDRRFGLTPLLPELDRLNAGEFFLACSTVPLALIFSTAEVDGMNRMARQMGLDYGELDVLRDHENGRIYVIDVNKTPVGPTIALDRRDMRRYLTAYTEAVDGLLQRFAVSG